MLVLSRGANEKVVFPTLGISVEILRIAGNRVRLGIEAPQDVPVHRQEIAERLSEKLPAVNAKAPSKPSLDHAIRNRLHSAALSLHVLHRKLEIEETSGAEAEIFKIFHELKSIESELQGDGPVPRELSHAPSHRALVVEDDDNERELLAAYLQLSGIKVDTAIDGMQAMVRLAEDVQPDVVLLDMKMPRFDGKSTIAAIRENAKFSDLKVFAVSGSDQEELGIKASASGINRWFSKPVDPRQLVDAIHEELRCESLSV